MSDYLQEGEAGFKKPKVRLILLIPATERRLTFDSQSQLLQKKKKRSTRVVEADLEDGEPVASTSTLPASADSMQVDSPAVAAPPPPPPTENFIDDDELQAALASARRKRSKKVAKFTPEDIAKQREYKLLR